MAGTAVAVSDSPVGPYRFIRSGRVNPGIYPLNMTKKERKLKWNLEQYKEWWTLKDANLSGYIPFIYLQW